MRFLLLLWAIALFVPGCRVLDGDYLATGEFCSPDGPDRCRPGFCLPLDESTGVCSESCLRHSDCPRPLICEPEHGGERAICKPGFLCGVDSECPSGHRCDAASGSCFIPVSRGPCSACQADPQCPPGGRCLQAKATGERFCTQPCGTDGSCPRGYVCGGGQCIPESGTCEGGRPLCAPCTGDAACGDGNDLCIENLKSRKKFCSRSCNEKCKRNGNGEWEDEGQPCVSECPENFECSDLSGVGSGPFQCVPFADTCEGYCEGGSLEKDRLYCGLGRTCDADLSRCVPAADGRVCAPCINDDSCNQGTSDVVSRCAIELETGSRFCVTECESDGACRQQMGPGFSCVDVEGTKLCLPDGGCGNGEGRLGEDCGKEGAASCLGGVCLHYGPVGICSGRCSVDDDCGSGYGCCGLDWDEELGGHTWDCAVRDGNAGAICVPKGGGFGEACGDGRPPCADGYCLDLGMSRVCTRGCGTSGSCPVGFRCVDARITDSDGSTASRVPVCFPEGGGGPGADCTFGPAACADQLCITKSSGNVCTQRCEHDRDCPKGWGCGVSELVGGAKHPVCLPPDLKE